MVERLCSHQQEVDLILCAWVFHTFAECSLSYQFSKNSRKRVYSNLAFWVGNSVGCAFPKAKEIQCVYFGWKCADSMFGSLRFRGTRVM